MHHYLVKLELFNAYDSKKYANMISRQVLNSNNEKQEKHLTKVKPKKRHNIVKSFTLQPNCFSNLGAIKVHGPIFCGSSWLQTKSDKKQKRQYNILFTGISYITLFSHNLNRASSYMLKTPTHVKVMTKVSGFMPFCLNIAKLYAKPAGNYTCVRGENDS